VRVVLADDAVLVREGLARLLEDRGVQVVGQAGAVDQLLALVAATRPDVAVIDIRMPPTFTTEGLFAARRIRSGRVGAATLVLSQHVEVDYALRLLADGVGGSGYLLKDAVVAVDAFIADLRRVAAGEIVVEPSLVAELVAAPRRDDPLADLTPREREVLTLMAQGRTDRGIAEALVVTRKTVEAHVHSILRKLGIPADPSENRRVHAVLAFLRAGG
jgi:serine/threonine-protein kinase